MYAYVQRIDNFEQPYDFCLLARRLKWIHVLQQYKVIGVVSLFNLNCRHRCWCGCSPVPVFLGFFFPFCRLYFSLLLLMKLLKVVGLHSLFIRKGKKRNRETEASVWWFLGIATTYVVIITIMSGIHHCNLVQKSNILVIKFSSAMVGKKMISSLQFDCVLYSLLIIAA